jgi:diguanylate cyclase (GGDEF)-like protein
VLAVDLDGFKRINELHGHGAGDAALIEVAQRLHAALRKSDLPARVGGDEFVVLLDDPDSPETARAVGERLLLALRAPITLPPPLGPIELSASVGLSHYPACGITAQSLLDAADAACYAAQHAGRNRLFEFRPDGTRPAYCTVCGGSPSVLPGRKSSVTSMASNS